MVVVLGAFLLFAVKDKRLRVGLLVAILLYMYFRDYLQIG